jgi:DNA repair exonuclease SbcCD ATPase subunit
MQEYMGLLSGGKISLTLEINDKSEVCLTIFGATAETYEMLSGGEKNIVRLAVDISLALLSFSLLSRKPEMICLDEVFGPLDDFNTENVFKMLMKLNSTFERILIISHKKDIQKAIKNNIIVEKSNGSSGLSEIKTLGELNEQ